MEPDWALGITQEERDKAAKSGAAMPDGSFPITECEGSKGSVKSAVGLARTDAQRAHVIKRAKSLGCSSLIPDSWNADGSKSDSDSAAANVVVASMAGRTLSRGELIAGWGYLTAAGPSPSEADASVTQAIAGVKDAVARAVEAQKNDPDTDDPIDQKVTELLSQIAQSVDELEKAQAADGPAPAAPAADDKKAPPPPGSSGTSTPPPPPATASTSTANRQALATPPVPGKPGVATTPKSNPTDANGDVENTTVCSNGDCQHMASAHGDTENGKNTGPCGMKNCSCPSMQVGTDSPDTVGDDDGGTDNTPADPADEETNFAAVVPIDGAPAVPGVATHDAAGTADANQPPPMPGGIQVGPAFTIPCMIIEGQPTGDGREIAPGALDWRVPPLPLMGLATEPHDPSGFSDNDPAVICGRIDSLERVSGENGTQIIQAKGFFLANEDGAYFADLVEAMGRCGISADVAVVDSEISIEGVDEMGWPTDMAEVLTKGTVMGATLCPFPAFEGCYIILGDGSEPEPIPQQVAASDVHYTAKPHFLTYKECEPCQQGIEVIAASAGPVRPPKAWFENPGFTEGDGRLQEIYEKRGSRKLGGRFACPITVTDEGRVYGHIAAWGVCHTAISGQCITAPRSQTDYAHFKRGQHVVTAEGEKVRVGVITAGTGHASQRPGFGASAAMAHYDNTGFAAADVNIGEDEYGIWVAGAVRPDATEEQIRVLRAASPSGDWRQLGGNLELVAVLEVNDPGFPLAIAASGQLESLVAAGATVMHRLSHPADESSPDAGSSLVKALSPLLSVARDHARNRFASVR